MHESGYFIMKQGDYSKTVMVTERSRCKVTEGSRSMVTERSRSMITERSRSMITERSRSKLIVCLCFFFLFETLAVIGQVYVGFNTERSAEEFGKDLRENWGIANEIGLAIEQKHEIWRVYLLSNRTVNGMPIVRDDFTTRLDAEIYGRNLKEKKGFFNKIIDCGEQLYCVALDINALDNSLERADRKTILTNAAKVSGKYIVVVGSYQKKSDAENHGKKLHHDYGYDYEILPAAVKGGIWYRVSVGGFDVMREADRFVKQWKQRHNSNVTVYNQWQ